MKVTRRHVLAVAACSGAAALAGVGGLAVRWWDRPAGEGLLALSEEARFHEIVDGELVPKAAPTAEHGDAQSWLTAILKPPFARRPGGGRPGGWWIMTEVEVLFADDEVYRFDVVGWRRERQPERPSGAPIRAVPGLTAGSRAGSSPSRSHKPASHRAPSKSGIIAMPVTVSTAATPVRAWLATAWAGHSPTTPGVDASQTAIAAASPTSGSALPRASP